MPSAGIVYEGVLANRTPDGNNNQNPYEGTLFNGLKFWISQRVPDRKSLEESVKVCVDGLIELDQVTDILHRPTEGRPYFLKSMQIFSLQTMYSKMPLSALYLGSTLQIPSVRASWPT